MSGELSFVQDIEFTEEDGVLYDEFYSSNFDYSLGEASDPSTTISMDPTTKVPGISHGQEIVLIVLQVGTAVLSLIGSSTIVFKITRTLFRKKWTTPYDRIMLALSTCDIVASCVYMLSPFLLPAETSLRPWTFGTASTCQFMGMLTQLACLWAIWYNCILSFYYLLTVRFQVKRETFRRKYELWFHLSGMIFFPITALVGYFGSWYYEHNLISLCIDLEVPTGCDEFGENCTGDADQIVGPVFAALPGSITFFSLLINNTVIYLYVRRSFSKTLKKPPQSERHETTLSSSSITDLENFNDDKNNTTNEDKEGNGTSRSSRTKLSRQLLQRKLIEETATQGFLYVFFFLLTLTPLIVLVVLGGFYGTDESDKAKLYPLLVLNSLLAPLQGFFNVFIYVRPTYTRFRAMNPNESMFVVLKQALFDPNIPSLETGVLSTRIPKSSPEVVETKHSQMKMKGGSNFSVGLDDVDEEEEEAQSDGDDDNGSLPIPTHSQADYVMTEDSNESGS